MYVPKPLFFCSSVVPSFAHLAPWCLPVVVFIAGKRARWLIELFLGRTGATRRAADLNHKMLCGQISPAHATMSRRPPTRRPLHQGSRQSAPDPPPHAPGSISGGAWTAVRGACGEPGERIGERIPAEARAGRMAAGASAGCRRHRAGSSPFSAAPAREIFPHSHPGPDTCKTRISRTARNSGCSHRSPDPPAAAVAVFPNPHVRSFQPKAQRPILR